MPSTPAQSKHGSLRINLGSGPRAVPGWINVDYAIGARIARLPLLGWAARRWRFFQADWDPSIETHDLRKPLPWADGTIDFIYSSHTLEHLSCEDGTRLIAECHRVLKPGGRIRMVVPDLRRVVGRYMRGELEVAAFLEDMGLRASKSRGVRGRLKERFQFPHRWAYDRDSLINAMSDAGFACEERAVGDSDLDGVDTLERQRFLETSVIVEGEKPVREGTGDRLQRARG